MRNYGAIEAGGTKMVLSKLNEQGEIVLRHTLPTGSPAETIPDMLAFFRENQVDALGIGCFGPLNLDTSSSRYGDITTTPKAAWRDFPFLRTFQHELGIPVKIDTDVNAAALAEATLGAAKGLESCLYVTIGTGIGGGWVIHGSPVHGLIHPELGHMLLHPDPQDPHPEGFCPFHKFCLEGLASGPAIQNRWGIPGPQLPNDHLAWELETTYLAQMCHNALMMLSPQCIILGGGVMQKEGLLPIIRKKTLSLMNGYISDAQVDAGLENLIVAPGLGVNSGVMGAYLLARQAAETQ